MDILFIKKTQFSIFYKLIIYYHKKTLQQYLYSLHFQLIVSDKVSHTHYACN